MPASWEHGLHWTELNWTWTGACTSQVANRGRQAYLWFLQLLQCSAGGLGSALELGSSCSGQELDLLRICQGFGFQTMPGHVNIDRSVSSGQSGASGQRCTASMQAGARYLQDLVGGIYAGAKGKEKVSSFLCADYCRAGPFSEKPAEEGLDVDHCGF